MMGQRTGGQKPLFYAFKLDDYVDERGEPVTVPASISPTDPAARWTAMDGPAFYAYSTNYLIDVQAGIIVDVEATPTLRTAEVKATRTMIERVEERFALKPERLIGDMAYGNAELLGWMVNDKGIEPHVPLWRCSSLTSSAS